MRIGRWVGLAGAIVFLIGFVMLSAIPGGGDVDAADFEEFYVDDERTNIALPGVYLVTLGALAMSWFLYELRETIGSTLARFGGAAALVGLAMFVVGAGAIAGPSGVQEFGDEPFVGANVAHALAQAGWAMALVGGALFVGAGIAALCVAGRSSGRMMAWVAIAGLVVAVLQLVSVIWLPALLIPVWVAVCAGAGVRHSDSSTPHHAAAAGRPGSTEALS